MLYGNPFGSNSGGGSGTGGDVPNASTSTAGKVKLSNSIDSASQFEAATSLAVKLSKEEAIGYTDGKIVELTELLNSNKTIEQYFTVTVTQNNTPSITIPMKNYSENDTVFLYKNTLKVPKKDYVITYTTNDVTFTFTNPLDEDTFNEVYILSDVDLVTVDSLYVHKGSVPPTDLGLVWNDTN